MIIYLPEKLSTASCPECSVALLRRAGSVDDGYWCHCGGRFVPKPSADPNVCYAPVVHRPVRYHRSEHRIANEVPGVAYEILEQRDGNARLCIDGKEHVLSPAQLDHLSDSASQAGRWGRARLDQLRGKHEWVSVKWGLGWKVCVHDLERILVETTIRKPRPCGACGAQMGAGVLAWKADPPEHHPAHPIDWRRIRLCFACPLRMERSTGLVALDGGRGDPAESLTPPAPSAESTPR